MAVLDPIKQKYDELVTFFQWWIPSYLPNAGLYLTGQNAPPPPTPFVGFQPITAIDYIGQDERRQEGSSEYLRGQRYLTCDIYGFSDSTSRFNGEENAWDMLQALRFTLGFPEVVDRLAEIEFRTVDEGTVQNISETQNTENQPRAMLQIQLSTVIIQPIDSGAIENINASGILSITDGDVLSNVSVSKP